MYDEPSLRERLEEAAGDLLVALGWGGTLRIGYSGEGGAVEDFEDALHRLSSLLTESQSDERCPNCGNQHSRGFIDKDFKGIPRYCRDPWHDRQGDDEGRTEQWVNTVIEVTVATDIDPEAPDEEKQEAVAAAMADLAAGDMDPSKMVMAGTWEIASDDGSDPTEDEVVVRLMRRLAVLAGYTLDVLDEEFTESQLDDDSNPPRTDLYNLASAILDPIRHGESDYEEC